MWVDDGNVALQTHGSQTKDRSHREDPENILSRVEPAPELAEEPRVWGRVGSGWNKVGWDDQGNHWC